MLCIVSWYISYDGPLVVLQHPEDKAYPTEDSPLLPELCKTLEGAGLHNPMAKIYVTTDPFTELPLIAAMYTLSYISKYNYDEFMSMLMPDKRVRRSTAVDICPLVVGIVSFSASLKLTLRTLFVAICAHVVAHHLVLCCWLLWLCSFPYWSNCIALTLERTFA